MVLFLKLSREPWRKERWRIVERTGRWRLPVLPARVAVRLKSRLVRFASHGPVKQGGCEAFLGYFHGDRAEIRKQAVRFALNGLLDRLASASLVA